MGHGGRIGAARLAFPSAPEPWLDLSTGINPVAYPAPAASAEARARLPDPEQTAALEAAAAAAFEVDDPARVAAVPGSEVALRILPHLLAARSLAILGPTYASHRSAWSQSPVQEVEACEQIGRDIEGLVLVRPNNPDGRVLAQEDLFAEIARRRFVIVDEAFVETDPRISLAPLAGSGAATGLIVLRSFGKFYGLAGLRLGFVIASPANAAAVRHLLGDWPVCADALVAGLAAYPDCAWAESTRSRLRADAGRLDHLLVRSGFTTIGGTSLFRLVHAPDARRRFERLAEAGILVRPFAHDPNHLRFGLPGSDAEFHRLATALGRA